MTPHKPECLPFKEIPNRRDSIAAAVYLLELDIAAGGVDTATIFRELTGNTVDLGTPPTQKQWRIERCVINVLGEIARTSERQLATSESLYECATKALEKIEV